MGKCDNCGAPRGRNDDVCSYCDTLFFSNKDHSELKDLHSSNAILSNLKNVNLIGNNNIVRGMINGVVNGNNNIISSSKNINVVGKNNIVS